MHYIYSAIAILCLTTTAFAKGISLDAVYMDKNSSEYQKLFFARFNNYAQMGAQFIDSDIVYSAWRSGKEIVYIKESGINNTIVVCSIATRKKNPLYTFKGTVISARTSTNGRYIAVKYFTNQKIPHPALFIIDSTNGNVKLFQTLTAGTDFSFSDDGNNFYYKKNNCIVAYRCDSSLEKAFLCSSDAPQWDEICTIIFNSNQLFVSGSSGNYSVYIKQKLWNKIGNAVTPMEIFSDSFAIYYTGGYPGNYTVNRYSVKTQKHETLLQQSLNPCLQVSHNHAIFLKNAFIMMYDSINGKLFTTTVESDEAIISPNGFYVASTIYNRLFIIPYATVVTINPKAGRYLATLQELYRDVVNKKYLHTSPYTRTYIQQKQTAIASLLTLF